MFRKLALLSAACFILLVTGAVPANAQVRISQIYGAGGNAGPPLYPSLVNVQLVRTQSLLADAAAAEDAGDAAKADVALQAARSHMRKAWLAAFAAARRARIDLVSINPSSVQGPGRRGGTGRIMIAYLNGRLPAFVDTHISLVDIADCVQGHLLGAERGVPGQRYLLNGATLSSREALDTVAELSGVRHNVRLLPPPVAAAAGGLVEAAFRLRGRQPPVCREMVRTLLHGHRYDGSRAARELGLRYTPVAETFRRTIEWAVGEGLVQRPAQSR